MNDGGEIVGMVDVLKLTYATLEQVSLSQNSCHCSVIANTSRSTPCPQGIAKDQHGTSSGYRLTMRPNQWCLEKEAIDHRLQAARLCLPRLPVLA